MSVKPRYHWRETILSYSFLAPAIVLVLLFLIIPQVLSLSYMFTDYYLLTPDQIKFIGIQNFVDIFSDPLVGIAIWNTVVFVVLVIPIQVGGALGLALLLNRKNVPGAAVFKVIYFAPVVLSLVVISMFWRILLNPDTGLINQLLSSVNVPKQPFLTDKGQAMPTIVFVSAWQGMGFQMLIFLAGLKSIPEDLYEAANLDGANGWQKFRYITLPGLMPTIEFVMITTVIAAFKLVIQPMVMTGGGPSNSTLSVVLYIYQTGFRFRNVGYASAVAFSFSLVIIAVSMIQRRIFKER